MHLQPYMQWSNLLKMFLCIVIRVQWSSPVVQSSDYRCPINVASLWRQQYMHIHIRTNMVAMKYMRKQCVPGNLSPPPPPYLGTRLLPGMQLQETFGCSFTVKIYPSWITDLCKFSLLHTICVTTYLLTTLPTFLIMLFIIKVIIWGCFSNSVLPPHPPPPPPIAYMVHPSWTPRLIETPNSIIAQSLRAWWQDFLGHIPIVSWNSTYSQRSTHPLHLAHFFVQ